MVSGYVLYMLHNLIYGSKACNLYRNLSLSASEASAKEAQPQPGRGFRFLQVKYNSYRTVIGAG